MSHSGAPPQWEILKDPSAPSPPNVLAQVSRDLDEVRSPLAILNKVNVKDGDLSVKIKPVAGKQDRAGGLVWRYHDSNNYYLLQAESLRNHIVLYKVQDGKRIPLAAKGMPPKTYGVEHPVPANGASSKCSSAVRCSAYTSTTGDCSRWWMPPSRRPVRWDCRPGPTASLISTISGLPENEPYPALTLVRLTSRPDPRSPPRCAPDSSPPWPRRELLHNTRFSGAGLCGSAASRGCSAAPSGRSVHAGRPSPSR
jgi:hypothetical protein